MSVLGLGIEFTFARAWAHSALFHEDEFVAELKNYGGPLIGL
jgi:hypothetical protein